ncbi:MAG: hypothetical protein KGO22_08575 [Gammaproteobacteria bacterium]|nr:hypothetical protein [Gammaproteobacteria bacterium]
MLVNQHRVRCARLRHGDVIAFGEAQFRYTVTPTPPGQCLRVKHLDTRPLKHPPGPEPIRVLSG